MKRTIAIFTVGCLILTGNLLSAQEGNTAATAPEGKFNEAATKLLISQAINKTITPEKLKKLKEKGADINAKYMRGDVETNLFLESVCFPGINEIENRMDGTFNFTREAMNRQNVLACLVDLGADTNVTDGKGKNALTLAILNICNDKYRDQLIKYLHKKAHVDINKADKIGGTPLMYAVFIAREIDSGEKGEVRPLITYLVNEKADVNAVDNDGATALMYAAQVNTLKTVQFLVNHGAKVSATDKAGRTAADYAKHRQFKLVLKYLEEQMLDSL